MSLIGRGNSLNGDNNTSTSASGTSDNPMFKIKLKSLETDYEQKAGGQTKDSNKEVKFTIGDIVSGQSIDSKKTITGKILAIHKNEQQLISFIEVLDDKTEKKEKLDPKSCSVKDQNNKYKDRKGEEGQQKVSYSAESLKYVVEFDKFK